MIEFLKARLERRGRRSGARSSKRREFELALEIRRLQRHAASKHRSGQELLEFILANFPERLREDQRVPDELKRLQDLAGEPRG